MVSVFSDRVEEAPTCTEDTVHGGAHAAAVEKVEDLLETGSLTDLVTATEERDGHVASLLFVHVDVGQACHCVTEGIPGSSVQAHEFFD